MTGTRRSAVGSGAWTLRPARPEDSEAIAVLWQRGWRDGHVGHVPDALLEHRHLDHFRRLLSERLDVTTVAELEARIAGFVTVQGDELEQLFVAEQARGGGTAAALLDHAETSIRRAGYDVAWLAVVAGNARARRFYERHGWSDSAASDYRATIPGGTIPVLSRRYEKPLRA